MTDMSDAELEALVRTCLNKINEALGFGLSTGQLLKTGYYRSRKV